MSSGPRVALTVPPVHGDGHVLTVNVLLVAPDGTVTVAETVAASMLSERYTMTPAAGAGSVRSPCR